MAEAHGHGRVSDEDRLAAVRHLLAGVPQEAFGRYSRLVSAALGVPTALFSVVDRDRQVFVAQDGLKEPYASQGSTPLELSYCRLVVEDDEPLVVVDSSRDPRVEGHPANTELGVAAYVGCPVRDPAGQTLGSLCAIDAVPRVWSDRDRQLLGDLAASLEAEIALIESRRRLDERLQAEQRQRILERSLLEAASASNRVQGIQATADALVEYGCEAVGASLISLAIVDGDVVRFHHGPGVHPDVAQDWTIAPPDVEVPMVQAAVTGREFVIPTKEAFDAWPRMQPEVEALGMEALVSVPIVNDLLGLRAAVGIGFDHPLTNIEMPWGIRRLVTLTRSALEQAVRFDAERVQAKTLEQVVLPTHLPRVEDLAIASAYLSPTRDRRVGGDLYDIVGRSDGAVGIVIADAVGHDLAATRAVARVRHAVGALTLQGLEPSALLSAVNRYVRAADRDRLITCAFLLLSADRRSVAVANAGHPPPLRIARGTAGFIGPVGDPLLGVADHEYRQETVSLESGDLLLAYTDGLIERRASGYRAGERWLVEIAEGVVDPDPDRVVVRFIELLADLDRDDDVALFGVQHRPEGRLLTLSSDRLLVERAAEDFALPALRNRVRTWLSHRGNEPDGDQIELIATELVSNARAASPPDAPVRFSMVAEHGAIKVSVTNRGQPFDLPPAVSGDGPGGRGLRIVQRLAASVSVRSRRGDVTVTATVNRPETSGNRNRLGVHERMDTHLGELPPVAGVPDATEGQAGVR